MRILIVEADADLGVALQEGLIMLGHEAVLVGSAEAAIWRADRELPDAVLLGARLPGMSAAEFLRSSRVRDAGLPIVVVGEGPDAEEARALGAVDVVPEPRTLATLRQIVAKTQVYRPAAPREDQPPAAAGGERRRAPRAALVVPVRVVDVDGREHRAMSMNLSTYGIKVAATAPLADIGLAQIVFTPPDAGDPLTVTGALVRVDGDGYAFSFVDLLVRDVVRLAAVMDRLVR